MTDVRLEVQDILRDVLDQPDLWLTPGLRATDVEDWDSLAHVSIMFTIESHFGLSFSDAEMAGLEDIDELISVVQDKTGGR